MKKKSFTLLEMMVVVTIIGIVTTIAIPNFTAQRERSFDNEAKAILSQMNAAEKIYSLEMGNYYPFSGSESGISNINDNLKLALNEENWDYLCDNTGCVQATRSGRSWRMCIAEDEPQEGDTCESQGGTACP